AGCRGLRLRRRCLCFGTDLKTGTMALRHSFPILFPHSGLRSPDLTCVDTNAPRGRAAVGMIMEPSPPRQSSHPRGEGVTGPRRRESYPNCTAIPAVSTKTDLSWQPGRLCARITAGASAQTEAASGTPPFERAADHGRADLHERSESR